MQFLTSINLVPTKRFSSTAFTFSALARTPRQYIGSMFVVAFIITGVLGYHVDHVSATAGQALKVVTSDGGGTFYIGRCFRTNLTVQTDNLNANSVDVILMYNPSYLQPYTGSGCTVAATAMQTNGLFGSYPANSIGGGLVEVTGYDPTGSSPVNTGSAPADKVLGHIFWKVIAASGAYVLPYQFTLGSTIDTNMAQQGGDGSDVLDFVDNLTIVLASDTTIPAFASLSPSSGATGVSVTTGVSYTFSDVGAGVNTGTLTHSLNGTSKGKTFSSCTLTNSNRIPSCNVTMSSVSTLSYNTLYRVSATGSDLASPSANTANQTWTFTTEDDTNAPYVTNFTPTDGSVGVAVGSNIVFHVKDYKNNAGVTPGLGVDLSTVSVTVTPSGGGPITYTSASGQFGYTGTSADYTITINPTADFDQNTLVSVSIDASDLHSGPNVMSTQNFSFTTTDSTAPIISGYSPSQGATGVSPDTNVSVRMTDGGAGVSISNTTVTINGTPYTSASGQFSYTGSSLDYTVTVNPSSNFAGGSTVSIGIATQDQASTPNPASSSYSFTIEDSCSTCSVDTEDPARASTSATLDNTVSFHAKDTGVGIQSSSIHVTLIGSGPAVPVSPLTMTGASAQMNITGTSSDYTVTLTLASAIEENVVYSILITATDTDGRAMSSVGYTFMNLQTTTTTTIVQGGTCSSSATTATTTGGNSRRTDTILESIVESDLPIIMARRVIPGLGTIVDEPLTAQDARNVRVCYVDVPPTHAAAPTDYTYDDVPDGAWFHDAVYAFLDLGILDRTKQSFLPSDSSARAELAAVLGRLHSGVPDLSATQRLSFDDTLRDAWYAPFTEFAGSQGWMRGYGNCFGTHPCTVMPAATITRAEAVSMLVRFYNLPYKGIAPLFSDVSSTAWYAKDMATAADYCVVQGVNGSRRAAPTAMLTRAEMIVLLDRARHTMTYGIDCGATKENHAAAIAPQNTTLISPPSSSFSSSPPPPHTEAVGSASSLSSLAVEPIAIALADSSTVDSSVNTKKTNNGIIASLIVITAIGVELLRRISLVVIARTF